MNNFHLTLRQRMLLNHLQHAHDYVTGIELSRLLNVSSRTIRNDISEINLHLKDCGVTIVSKNSFGYLLQADNTANLRALTQTSSSLISRPERIRFIAEKLCLSEAPLNLDELADEMFISKTTLEHELSYFRKTYVLAPPYIAFFRKNNTIAFEDNERKRRAILCRLIAENWNYNEKGNSFFHYTFLTDDMVDGIMREINFYLEKHQLIIEDINMIHLFLLIAIAYQRMSNGKILDDIRKDVSFDPTAKLCCDEFLNAIEKKFDCHFPKAERIEIYELLSCSSLPDMDKIKEAGASLYFSNELIDFANGYLSLIEKFYGISLSHDEDFYLTLLTYLHYISLPIHHLNTVGMQEKAIEQEHFVEFELAMAIQPLALDYYGNYLNFVELVYLSIILSGALVTYYQKPLKTVLLCQYNAPITWWLKRQIEERFVNRIEVTQLLPMYQKDNFDFSSTDLILATTSKEVNTDLEIPQFKISPFFFEENLFKLQQYIENKRIEFIYKNKYPDIIQLLENAEWHEFLECDSYFSLIEYMANNMMMSGYTNEKFLTDIFQREKLLSFSCHPCYILIHSQVPAKKTHLQAVTLKHRINVNGNKIRMALMLSTTDEDRTLVFKLYHSLYQASWKPEDTRFLKTKVEYINFISNRINL